MSYILDALRKAEADRQRGQVPGLHDSSAALGLETTPRAASALRWLLPAAVLGAALLGAVAWWGLRTPAQQPLAQVPLPPPPQPVPAPAPTRPLPVVVSAPPTAPAPTPVASPPAAAPLPSSAPASAPASDTRPLKFSELSPELQREMPPLVPGGSVWSESAASRFVVLNGQVLREGDTVAPGLVLARIGPRSAVLRWRGLLVELPL